MRISFSYSSPCACPFCHILWACARLKWTRLRGLPFKRGMYLWWKNLRNLYSGHSMCFSWTCSCAGVMLLFQCSFRLWLVDGKEEWSSLCGHLNRRAACTMKKKGCNSLKQQKSFSFPCVLKTGPGCITNDFLRWCCYEQECASWEWRIQTSRLKAQVRPTRLTHLSRGRHSALAWRIRPLQVTWLESPSGPW